MNSTNPSLALIIPALNESAIIMRNVNELKVWMKSNLPDMIYEIVVVNDGSTDGMGEMLEKESKNDPNLRVLHHIVNMGRGRAVRTGMENTHTDYLIALDADLSYSPDHIKILLAPLMNGQAELTLASPYHADGVVKNVPAFRAWLSKWGNKFLSGSFQSKISTSTCVVRGYTRKLIDHLELINNGKDFHLEVLYKTEVLGFHVVEVPASLVWRDKDRGKAQKGRRKLILDNPLFKMRKAIFSHFVFNFFSKPKLLFLGPISFLFVLAMYGTLALLSSYVAHVVEGVETPMRSTLIKGQLTLSLMLGSYILLFAFTFFLFLASQAKKYFEEQYILSSRTNYRIRQLHKTVRGEE